MMQTHGELCIGWLHGLGVPALHSKVPCTYSVCNPGLFDETRLSKLCRDDLAFDFRSSPDGSADDPEVVRRNSINSTRINEGHHFKTESAGSGCPKTGSEIRCTSSDVDPLGNPDPDTGKDAAPPLGRIQGPVASESRGELLECEAGLSAVEDLLRHYWLLRDSEEEIQKMKTRLEPVHNQAFNWLLKKSYDDNSVCSDSSLSEPGEDGDEIRFDRDDTDSLASLSTIPEEDPEDLSSSADSSNRMDALFGDPDRQDFSRLCRQHSRPSFGVQNAAEISTKVDELFDNEQSSSRDYEDSCESLDDGEGEEEEGNPTSDSEGDGASPPPLSADDTFARIFSRHVTDTCPSFSPEVVSRESDVEDDRKNYAPGTSDDQKDTEANSQAIKNGEYTISDTRVHLNLIGCQDDHQTTDDLILGGKENSGTDVVAGRSSSIASPASWYTVSDVFDSQCFEIAGIADNVAAGDVVAMSAAYANCTAVYRRSAAADSSATDSPATWFSVSTKVTAVDPVTALSRAASRVASLAAANACPVGARSQQGNLEISLTASCSLSSTRGDLDGIPTDGGNDADVSIHADLRQAFDTVDLPDLPQAFDTVDNAERRRCNIEADLTDQKHRFISMIDSATETINSVADVAVQSDIDSFPASTRMRNPTHKDASTGEDEEVFVLAQNSAEAGNDFSCQIALPSMKISEGSKSSGYGSRTSSDDLLEDPDSYEITGVAIKEFPKFKEQMPQNTDASQENEEFGQKLPTRAIEVNYSDQEVQQNIGKELGTPIWIDGSIENRISRQEPPFENKPTNNKTSDKTINEDSSNFVRRNDIFIPTERRNVDTRQAFDTVDNADMRQAFDTVDNAGPRCCNIEADLSDQKIQTEEGAPLDNQKDICHVRGATEDERRYKNRESAVASRDYVRRRDTPRGVSRPVIRSKSLLLETDIDTLEHRRTIVARNCSTLSVGENNTNNTSRLLEEGRKQRSNKSRDYFTWDSSADLLSKETLEFMLCDDDASPPKYFAKKRSDDQDLNSLNGGGYYSSEPNLKPNSNKRNSTSRNSNEKSTASEIHGAPRKPVDRTSFRVGTGDHHHHHDYETRNAIERYESSPSLRRRSLSILTPPPSSGRRKNSDVTTEMECKPEFPKRPQRPVNSSFENLVDSLLGITAVMSMETTARCGSSPPLVASKGGGKPRGGRPPSRNPIPPSIERRTFARPSPTENETKGDQGRTSSSSLLSPLVPRSVSPDAAPQTTPARSLPVIRKHEHFRKAKYIFLKCGFCSEGNGTPTPAKGKAPVAPRKTSNGVDKKTMKAKPSTK